MNNNNNKKKENDPMELSIFHYIFDEKKYEYNRDVFNNNDIIEVYILCKRYYLKYKKNINDIELEVELRKNDLLDPSTIKSLYINMIFNNRKEYDKHIQNREWFMGEVRDKLNDYIIKKGALDYAEIYRETDPAKKERLFNDYKKPELISFEEEEIEEKIEEIEFPLGIFTPMIQNNIFELNKTENFSIDFMANAYISAMAPIFGRRYTLQYNNTFMANCIFWICLVGEPGSKKSQPLSMILETIDKIDAAEHKQYEIEKTQKEKNEKTEKGEKNKKTISSYKQIIVKDATIESIYQVHSINKKGLLLYNDELSKFFNSFGRYKNGSGDGDKASWLEMYNGKSITINRVSRETLRLNSSNVSIVGGIQYDPLLKIMNGDNDGLFERFLYSKNGKDREDTPHKDTDISFMKKWSKRIKEVNDILKYDTPEDGEIILFDIKKHGYIIDEWTKELRKIKNSDDTIERLKKYISKIETYLPRFILFICLTRFYFSEKPANSLLFNNKPEVEEDDIKKGILLCRYYINTYKNVIKDLNDADDLNNVDSMARKKGANNKQRIYNLADKGYKQKDIAKKTGTSASYISKVLKNR